MLPVVDSPFPGSRGYLLAGAHGQVVFWHFASGARVPRHQHGPQIGVVITGQVDLTTATSTQTICEGGSFSLNDQEPHSAVVTPGTLVIEMFADPDRHTARRPS
ncbi:hypothetical protein [Nocardia sp. NPDC057227]|uniref:hypothetical protein n=1 Tax=Nocardia sp. NPDC057227 TaxID=3346056 RepID=UPI003629E223